MTSASDFELVVLGGGPGGFDAALAAAGKGLSTALVERGRLGGTCLNRGCIPTKLFLGATRPIADLAAQKRMRVAEGEVTVNLPALQKRKEKLLSSTRQAMLKRLEAAGVTLFQGLGRLADGNRLNVETESGPLSLGFEKLIIATGSRPSALPGLEPDGEAVLDSDGLLDLQEAPGSLVIIGGGAIGLEMAEFFHRLGSQVTIIEALDRLAPWEDPEISEVFASMAKRRKWTLKLGIRVKSLKTIDGRARIVLTDGEELFADKALVAVGRSPNTANLGLEDHGVTLDKHGFVIVDEHLCATENIYAIGDANGQAMLAHTASHQAEHMASYLAAKSTGPYESGPVPWLIWGGVESVRVGPLADELKAQCLDVRVSRATLAGNPTAQAAAESQGLVKIAWLDSHVAGISVAGHAATHLATQAVIMVAQGWTRKDAAKHIFAHPTLDESLKEALLAETNTL